MKKTIGELPILFRPTLMLMGIDDPDLITLVTEPGIDGFCRRIALAKCNRYQKNA
jgi:hypothetical protein